MHNIMKMHVWAEPYVNFLKGETPPLSSFHKNWNAEKQRLFLLSNSQMLYLLFIHDILAQRNR